MLQVRMDPLPTAPHGPIPRLNTLVKQAVTTPLFSHSVTTGMEAVLVNTTTPYKQQRQKAHSSQKLAA